MPKFCIELSQPVTQTARLYIEDAQDAEEARRIALSEARHADWRDFSLDGPPRVDSVELEGEDDGSHSAKILSITMSAPA
jgi:hypothetical protein